MAFTPSKYQKAFFDWIAQGRGSCVLVAVAGSGKTTSVVEGLKFVKPGASVKLLAFNATIAKELTERLTEHKYDSSLMSASTFHSLGFGAVRKHLQGLKVTVGKPDPGKLRNLAQEALGRDSEDYAAYADYAVKLVGLARGEGIGVLTPDTTEAWANLAAHHDLQLETEDTEEGRGIEIARNLLQLSNRAAKRGIIDFDDMLYCVVLWKLRLWQNDWVFIDEAQDTNPVRRAIAKLALRPGGRLVAVGDPRQAIYGFTGASHDAIDLIKSEFNAVELPLTVSYRCARSIVELAQTVVSHIEAAPGAQDGAVLHHKLADAMPLLDAHSAVLCRQTAPLIKMAFSLIAGGTGCKVLGRDIGAGLTSLVKKAKAKGLDKLMEKLGAWRDREVAKHTAKGEELKAESVHDKFECIATIANSLDLNNRTIPALLAAIEGLFSDSNGCLTLSTVHKAKGREWDTVAILRSDLMPSKWARQEWQAAQEQNLMYVAYTRAKKTLIFISKEK